MTEHLHIDWAKQPYRESNKKDTLEYSAIWIGRTEKMNQQALVVKFRQGESVAPPSPEPKARLLLTKNPSATATFSILSSSYSASAFVNCLKAHLCGMLAGVIPARQAYSTAIVDTLHTRTLSIPVFHRIRITLPALQDIPGIADRNDAINARPAAIDKNGKITRPAHFDPAFIDEAGDAEESGIGGEYRLLISNTIADSYSLH